MPRPCGLAYNTGTTQGEVRVPSCRNRRAGASPLPTARCPTLALTLLERLLLLLLLLLHPLGERVALPRGHASCHVHLRRRSLSVVPQPAGARGAGGGVARRGVCGGERRGALPSSRFRC
jgi:hypothetical protein